MRTRHTWPLLRGGTGPLMDQAALSSYRDVAARVFQAIVDETGARVIVDSSKRPSDGALTTLLPGVEPYFVHLVRDPRAVVHSWRRVKRELDSDVAKEMPRQGRIESALGWAELNAFSDLVRRRVGPGRSLLLRYEDFVRQPLATVHAIARLVDEADVEPPFEGDHAVRMSPTHTVSGNPARFSTGVVELRADTEWSTGMPPVDRWLTTTITLPLLLRYGYPILPRDGAGR